MTLPERAFAAMAQRVEVQILNDLLSLGVDGFRIDAAKHMAARHMLAVRFMLAYPTSTPVTKTVETGLTPGRYRDVLTGSPVDIDAAGKAVLTIPATGAVALMKE